jgi:DNA-binding response OmpR family regulator
MKWTAMKLWKRIRSQIKFKRLPVIALTAKKMKDVAHLIDAGANDYIPKTNRCRPTFIINACLVSNNLMP